MPKNYWMVVQTPEEFSVSNDRGFDIHGLRYTYKKRARRIEPDDCVLVYVSGIRKWTATCTFTSRYFEDRQPIWNLDGTEDQYPLRVHMSPAIVLDEADYRRPRLAIQITLSCCSGSRPPPDKHSLKLSQFDPNQENPSTLGPSVPGLF